MPAVILGRTRVTIRRGRMLAAAWLGLGVAGLAGARETWLKVATPEVTVVTTLGAGDAATWATEFVQYIAALRSFFGDHQSVLPSLTIVVFARDADFQRYLPMAGPGGKPQPVGGFFVRHESWAVVGMPARVSEETRRTIFHEGVHWFLSTSRTRNPVWLEEGLAEVFSTFHAAGPVAEWGRAIESHVRMLRSVPLLPLAQLLRTEAGEVFGNDRVRTGVVYGESWAFVHYLMFGRHDLPRDAINRYLESVSGGTPPEAAFRGAFGRTYAEMDRQLRAYLKDGDYLLARLPLAGAAKPAAQAATAIEVENALGRLAMAGRRPDQAMGHAGAALAAAPDDPRGHELLALALKAKGDLAGALVSFQAAVARGTREFQPHFEVAGAAQLAARDEHRALSPAEARTIAGHYGKAIQLYPRYPAAYENFAGLMGLADPVGDEDRKVLELGRRLFPENVVIEIGLAQLARRGGDTAGARVMLHRVLASGATGERLELAQRLRAAWDFEDAARRIDELARAGRLTEAIARVDEQLAAGGDPALRARLVAGREQLQAALLGQQIKLALDAKRWPEARRALGQLLESAAPAAAKEQARRTLAELDARRLGLEGGATVAPPPK